MEKLIACCGLNCASCDARIATLADDDTLRAETAEKWKAQFNAPDIAIETINCTGCMEPGIKFGHCLECNIRKCAIAKGYKTCSECAELKTCSIIASVINNVPGTLQNLLDLRN